MTPTIPTELLRFNPADWGPAAAGPAARWELLQRYWQAREAWQREHGLDSEAMDALSRAQWMASQ